MFSRGITDSTSVIGRRDSHPLSIRLSLLWTESDEMVGLNVSFGGVLIETAYALAYLADVAWWWFIWISSFRSILRWLIGAFLDPVLLISSVDGCVLAYPWCLTDLTDVSFGYRSFL
jgi:hypothetical protein